MVYLVYQWWYTWYTSGGIPGIPVVVYLVGPIPVGPRCEVNWTKKLSVNRRLDTDCVLLSGGHIGLGPIDRQPNIRKNIMLGEFHIPCWVNSIFENED